MEFGGGGGGGIVGFFGGGLWIIHLDVRVA